MDKELKLSEEGKIKFKALGKSLRKHLEELDIEYYKEKETTEKQYGMTYWDEDNSLLGC